MTEQHVPVDHLAAYAAGDLDATAALEVEAHVLLCAQCRADAEAVTRATAALASLEPVTMPAEVAARVDAALAAADAPAGPVGDVLPMVPKRRRPSFAGIAAVAAGLALFGAIGIPLLGGGNGGDSGSPTALDAGREATGTKRLESGLNYTHGNIGDTLVLALGGSRDEAGVKRALRSAAPQAVSPDAAGAPAEPTSSGVGFTSGDTAAEVSAKSGTLARFQADPGRLAACVAALADGLPAVAQTPLLVDFALFENAPALVVVFPTVRGSEIRPDRIDVFVAGPRCGITPGDDDVLDFARFQRPSGL